MYGRIIQRNTEKAISRRIRIIEYATVFGKKGEMSSSKDADKKPVPVSGGNLTNSNKQKVDHCCPTCIF